MNCHSKKAQTLSKAWEIDLNEFVSQKAKTALKEIGLTGYEIQAYLQLLHMGATTARQISKDSNVPYSKIYEVLNSLEKKGWIRIQAGRPKRYYAKAPVESLELTKLRLQNTMKTWQKSFSEELQPIYDRIEMGEKPDVWIFRGESNAIAKLKEMILKSKRELMITVSAVIESLATYILLSMTRKLTYPHMKIVVLLERNKNLGLKNFSRFGEVRVRNHMFGSGIIADNREVLLILGSKKTPLIIWSDHLGLVKFAKDYFLQLWNTANRVER